MHLLCKTFVVASCHKTCIYILYHRSYSCVLEPVYLLQMPPLYPFIVTILHLNSTHAAPTVAAATGGGGGRGGGERDSGGGSPLRLPTIEGDDDADGLYQDMEAWS